MSPGETWSTPPRRISPSLSLGIGGPTELTIGLMHQSQWDRPDYGVPWIDFAGAAVSHPAPVPWNNDYGFRDDYSEATADIATVSLRHDLGDGWAFDDQLRVAGYSRGYRITEPTISALVGPATPLASLTVAGPSAVAPRARPSSKTRSTSADHSRDLGTDPQAGAERPVGQQTSDPTVLSFSGVPATNLIAPDEQMLFSGASKPKSIVRFTADTAAISAGDTVDLGPRWQFDGAIRLDRFAADYNNAVPQPAVF